MLGDSMRNPIVRELIANPKRNSGKHGKGKYDKVLRHRMESEIRELALGGFRVQEHGGGQEEILDKLSDIEASKSLPTKE